jgi:RNA polymerase sigma factor (sigma-70 family)
MTTEPGLAIVSDHDGGFHREYFEACRKALGALVRVGVLHYIEKDELIGVGCLAIVMSEVRDEALAVTIAQRAMMKAIERNEVRQRGRVRLSNNEDEISDEDAMDELLYSSTDIAPEERLIDVNEAMSALTTRQYDALSLRFWDNASQAEIASEMKIDQSNVSRAIDSAKRAVRDRININSTKNAPLDRINKRAHRITLLEGKHTDSQNKHIRESGTEKNTMRLLRTSKVAELLDVRPGTVGKLNLPGMVRVGSRKKYIESSIIEFIKTGGSRPNPSPVSIHQESAIVG